MRIQRISAFSDGLKGGNPAGVALYDAMPEAEEMQQIAANIGYSETVFAVPSKNGWRIRFFSPEVEVDFCGHATIALGAALAKAVGPGNFSFELNHAQISVEGRYSDDDWGASFFSPPTSSRAISNGTLKEALTLFNLGNDDLDTRIKPAIANGGGDHLILALRDRKTLQEMQYDQNVGRELSAREGLVTFSLIYAEQSSIFYSRNPFPIGGVYEDPATGAAAAALAGYLRETDWPHEGSLTIYQGQDMGMPSRLDVVIPPHKGAGIRVSGSARLIE